MTRLGLVILPLSFYGSDCYNYLLSFQRLPRLQIKPSSQTQWFSERHSPRKYWHCHSFFTPPTRTRQDCLACISYYTINDHPHVVTVIDPCRNDLILASIPNEAYYATVSQNSIRYSWNMHMRPMFKHKIVSNRRPVTRECVYLVRLVSSSSSSSSGIFNVA